jgi:FHA domain
VILTPPPITPSEPPAVPDDPPADPATFITVPPGFAPAPALSRPTVDVTPKPVIRAADDDLDATRAAAPRRVAARWALRLADGDIHPIAGSVVLGREPDIAAAPGASGTLRIDDPARSVSKSHAVIETDGDRLWVRDLSSTNGVVVVLDDGSELVVGPARTALEPECDLELGSYVIRVVRE